MARFTREAQLLATLNHSHIAMIFGVEDDGRTRALVMEPMEGPTLKVLDFGLAKAMSENSPVSDPVNSPTLTLAAVMKDGLD